MTTVPKLADVVTLADAAELLGVSESSARHWAAAGIFPGDAARRVSGRWLVSVRRLERYLHGDDAA